MELLRCELTARIDTDGVRQAKAQACFVERINHLHRRGRSADPHHRAYTAKCGPRSDILAVAGWTIRSTADTYRRLGRRTKQPFSRAAQANLRISVLARQTIYVDAVPAVDDIGAKFGHWDKQRTKDRSPQRDKCNWL
jgi:hypothetical protein